MNEKYLHGVHWPHKNLAFADLSQATLTRANLEKANLEKANLWRANLDYVFGREACFKKANMREIHGQNINLEKAFMEGVDLHGAQLVNSFL